MKYGLEWSAAYTPLDIELTCFRKNIGLGAPAHFRRIAEALWPKTLANGKPNPRWFEWHPWAVTMLDNLCTEKFLGIAGCGSSGKTQLAALWAIISWLASPKGTLVIIVSTSLKDSRERIWGAVENFWIGCPGLPGKLISSAGRIRLDLGNGEKAASDNCGLTLIAGDQSKAKEAAANLIGKKNQRVVLIADEHPELSESINEAALGNLSLNPHFQFVGIGNPASFYDAFGMFITPADGWESVHSEMDSWKTRYGKCIRLDGLKSPNWLAGKNIYRYLIKVEDIQNAIERYGENSPVFWRMFRGYFCPSNTEHTVFSEADIAKFGGMDGCVWKSPPITVAALDPAFTSGGDESILYIGKWGVEAVTDNNVLLLTERLSLREDVTDLVTPRNFQIAQAFRRECEKRKIPPEQAAYDATNIPFADIVSHVWSPKALRTMFGGKPTDRPVSQFSPEPASERYDNKVTELWFSGMEFLKHKQLRGIDKDLAKELVSRRVGTKKSGSPKLVVERKTDMKGRIGRSPDMSDAAMVLVDLIRERFGGRQPRVKSSGEAVDPARAWMNQARKFGATVMGDLNYAA